MKPRILILNAIPYGKIRKTIDDHLYSFKRYTEGVQYHYFNAWFGVPRFLTWIDYDAVILHYTFLSIRWDRESFPLFYRSIGNLKNIKGYKIAMPQDEYAHTQDLWKLFRENKVETVFTCAFEDEFEKFYPKEKSGIKHHFNTFPGYVDEKTLNKIKKQGYIQEKRNIDIGYRARKLPYWIGRYPQRKYEIGEVVKDYCEKHTNLRVDISSENEEVFYGDDWLKFLGRCKATLGCESGSRLMDADDKIRECVKEYMKLHPQATFDEVEENCFSGKEGDINLLTVSPRHFEAAMTKTCQILIEGNYAGILKPNLHYIPLKKDYSNLEEVIEKVQDGKYRMRIVENAYRDLVISGKYSYRSFANQVIDHIHQISPEKLEPITRLSPRRAPLDQISEALKQIMVAFFIHLTSLNIGYHLRRLYRRAVFKMIIEPGSAVRQKLFPSRSLRVQE